MVEPHKTTNGSLLDEPRLKQISRSIRTFVPHGNCLDSDDDSINQFKTLLLDVFATSSTAGLSAPHRVAAWNTLCSLIAQALESASRELQDPKWIDEVWLQAFDLYLNHARNAKPKSSRQLLGTLITVLRRHPDMKVSTLKQKALARVMQCLLEYNAPHTAKASAQLLGQLLLKDVISYDDVLAAVQISFRIGSDSMDRIACSQVLLEIIFTWLSSGDFGSTITQLLAILLDKFDDDPESRMAVRASQTQRELPIWINPLEQALLGGTLDINDLRAHVLPMLFKRKYEDFIALLHAQGFWANQASGDGHIRVERIESQDAFLYAALQTGKELGFIIETDDDEPSQPSRPINIAVSWISRLSRYSARTARLTAISLLISSQTATRPFSVKTLRAIRQVLNSAFADVDADFRSAVFSAFQKLVDRLRATCSALARRDTQAGRAKVPYAETGEGDFSLLMKHLKSFLQWLLRFLSWELRPTTSYQRHISALKCLSMVIRSGIDSSIPTAYLSRSASGDSKWPFNISVLTDDVQRLLLDLVADPFDDVRQTAAAILTLRSLATDDGTALHRLSGKVASALDRAEAKLLITGRADQADGVGHLYALYSCTEAPLPGQASLVVTGLMEKLDSMIQNAERDLSVAVSRYPLHGVLTSLRYVLLHDPAQHAIDGLKILSILRRVWTVVKPVLCNDAPEGFALEEHEEELDATKETLSYCWRALKEASLLLNVIITCVQFQEHGARKHLVLDMSDLCFAQLAELRHRGAFSTVAQTWTNCCVESQALGSNNEEHILDLWYGKVMSMLEGNVTINTRRSAGMPSLICGIVIADKSDSLLHRAFTDLEAVSRRDIDAAAAEEGSLAQVHAMNCVKDLLKNSRLGEQSEPFVAGAFQLAADSLRSNIWAIRNCGLMLFRAVVDRLLKTDQSHFDDDFIRTRQISGHHYPTLLRTMIDLLPQPADIGMEDHVRYEGVFASLQLLQHVSVPSSSVPRVKHAIHALACSSSWHMRDKAARTFAAVMCKINVADASSESRETLRSSTFSRDQNAIHGALLITTYVLQWIRRRLADATAADEHEQRSSLVRFSQSLLSVCSGYTKRDDAYHPVNRAALIDLVRECTSVLSTLSLHDGLSEADVRRQLNELWLQRSSGSHNGTSLYAGLWTDSLRDQEAAVDRQAVARLIAEQICSGQLDVELPTEEFLSFLLDLARADEDACKALLCTLRAHKPKSDNLVHDFTVRLSRELIKHEFGVELQCEALKMLLDQEKCLYPTEERTEIANISHEGYMTKADCNQEHADLWLQLRAMQLDLPCQDTTQTLEREIQKAIESWIEDCVEAIGGDAIHSREAAAHACRSIRHLWKTMSLQACLQHHLLQLCIAIYDLTNDDDEEMRLLAAEIAQRLLATVTTRENFPMLEPIVAGQRLLGFCVARWPDSRALAQIVSVRAYGVSETEASSVSAKLDLLTCVDGALFAEEKQNLYVDEAKEARTWSQVILQLDSPALSEGLIKNLTRWIITGLDALRVFADTNTDGAMGWSTNSDVFVLGLQVIYGTEVLMHLVRRGLRIPVRPSELRRQLYQCFTALEASDANCLWLSEAQRVLRESVLHKMRIVSDTFRLMGQV